MYLPSVRRSRHLPRGRLAGRTPCISFRKPCIHDRLYPKRDSAVESDRGRCDLPSVVGLQCAWMQRERTCRCDSQNDRSLCVGRRAVRKNWRTVLRINLACQRSRIADGCERLETGRGSISESEITIQQMAVRNEKTMEKKRIGGVRITGCVWRIL